MGCAIVVTTMRNIQLDEKTVKTGKFPTDYRLLRRHSTEGMSIFRVYCELTGLQFIDCYSLGSPFFPTSLVANRHIRVYIFLGGK